MAPGRERRRGDPEHLLRPDPRDHRVGDGFVEDAHNVLLSLETNYYKYLARIFIELVRE